ncbi:MAG: DUF6591 domain-containing protein [Chitinophagaceae bacterium]
MKLKHWSAIVFFAALCLHISSCGSKTKTASEISVIPKNIIIKGELGDFFEVIKKDYQIKRDENSALKDEFKPGILSVEIKRNEKDFTFPADKAAFFGTSGYDVEYHVGFGIELFGDGGPDVIKNANDYYTPLDDKDVLGLIHLKKGETGYMRFSIDKLTGLKTFQLTSALVKTTAWSKDSNSTKSSEENTSNDDELTNSDLNSPSIDCDKFLNDYEAFIDSYVKILKKYKANPNDVSIVNEYNEAAQRAIELGNKVPLCTDTKYASKLLELQNKITKAAL